MRKETVILENIIERSDEMAELVAGMKEVCSLFFSFVQPYILQDAKTLKAGGTLDSNMHWDQKDVDEYVKKLKRKARKAEKLDRK